MTSRIATPDFHRWIDNQTYLAGELEQYLATMKQHWRQIDPELFAEPVLHQWGYFFNPPGQTMWQTGQRALDIYRCAAHVDGVLFIASPLNADNRADAMALSVESSIMRCANEGRPFTSGLYLGRQRERRHLLRGTARLKRSEHSWLAARSACITMDTAAWMTAAVLFRMDDVFKDSLRAGNRWAGEVIPLLDAPRAKQVAILFPAEMSLYEPVELDIEGRHRMDLLGWYSQFADLGGKRRYPSSKSGECRRADALQASGRAA